MADNGSEVFICEDEDDEENSTEEEVETPDNLIWIYSPKGVEYFENVLKMLTITETSETQIAKSLLTSINNSEQNSAEAAHRALLNLLKEISVSFLECYHLVEHIKCPKKKVIDLERNFISLSGRQQIKEKWKCLLTSCGLLETRSHSVSIVLEHVLQHFCPA